MPRLNKQQEYYNAFIQRDSSYDGIFVAAIKTTGIFCHPSCSARPPKFENCEFFDHPAQALQAGYRPCKRCRPTSSPQSVSAIITILTEAIANSPHQKWSDKDVRQLGINPSTARRQFKERFGMTFIAYARAQRMGNAHHIIRSGEKIIHAQIDSGYESGSGFRDAFSKIIGSAPSTTSPQLLYSHWIDTPLGTMVAIADHTHLHLLEFSTRKTLEKQITRLRKIQNAAIIAKETTITQQISEELNAYFLGTLQTFQTPVALHGNRFQQSVWQALKALPYGQTLSYSQLARQLNKADAVRAVANANGRNQLAIIIPCHRIIGTNGSLTGYAGGLARKEWLLSHEQKYLQS